MIQIQNKLIPNFWKNMYIELKVVLPRQQTEGRKGKKINPTTEITHKQKI